MSSTCSANIDSGSGLYQAKWVKGNMPLGLAMPEPARALPLFANLQSNLPHALDCNGSFIISSNLVCLYLHLSYT